MKERITLMLAIEPSRDDFERLENMLKAIGVSIAYRKMEVENELICDGSLVMEYDPVEQRTKLTRNSGRKRKKIQSELTIGEIKQMAKKEGLEKVLVDLSISRPTYFRKLREAKQKSYLDTMKFKDI